MFSKKRDLTHSPDKPFVEHTPASKAEEGGQTFPTHLESFPGDLSSAMVVVVGLAEEGAKTVDTDIFEIDLKSGDG